MASTPFTPSKPFHTRWAQSSQAGRGCAHKNIKEGQQSPCQGPAVGHIHSQQESRMPDPLQLQPLARGEVTAFLHSVNITPPWKGICCSPFTQQHGEVGSSLTQLHVISAIREAVYGRPVTFKQDITSSRPDCLKCTGKLVSKLLFIKNTVMEGR